MLLHLHKADNYYLYTLVNVHDFYKYSKFIVVKKFVSFLFLVWGMGIHSWAQTQVLLVTTEGNIVVQLYDDTPLHKENFLKLVQSHFYDSTLFHRIVKEFMIQGGDPDSKHAAPGMQLGNGTTGYTIPAEFKTTSHFHKKGALAAARMGDDVNPSKASSGCQFYIVVGKVWTEAELNTMEQRMQFQQKQELFSKWINLPQNNAFKNHFVALQQQRKTDSLAILQKQAAAIIDQEFAKIKPAKISAEQRSAYTSIGGTPHLDGNYTVFGEVVDGLDIVERISNVNTIGERPATDVRIIRAMVVNH